MTPDDLIQRLRAVCSHPMPPPAQGRTAERHRRLMEIGREDLSLAKLAEAHFDAHAILAEAGRPPVPGSIYAVWASEIPGHALILEDGSAGLRISGRKMFCSGAGLVDRALITAGEGYLVEVDLRQNTEAIKVDGSGWSTDAFRSTATSSIELKDVAVHLAPIGGAGWYVDRPGFWHGALGPAACWAGGAAGLVAYALANRRQDPHTLAHLGAMKAGLWAMEACLEVSAREIDADPADRLAAQVRALEVRHLIEQGCSDILQRFARAYGPAPLAMDSSISRRYRELDLYVRQSHAERDLESLGRLVRDAEAATHGSRQP